ncbi:hypothetical protein PG993_013886 [Apiospora rasikravindrae]|uniref:Uncharacterized protein n=1 Tax=Apiospora rasikravindrae TaxID=990691 RepID=A0ABR1RRH1_9PEZI
MQEDMSYHHLHPSSSGGDTALSRTVSERSEPISSFGVPPAYSHYPTSIQKGVDIDHPHRRQQRATSLWAEWTWELLLLLLGVPSLVATAVTLYRLSGNSLESWGGFFLGPNTVVSILAAIPKTSLAFAISSCVAQSKWNWYRRGRDHLLIFERFDEASKGPWGSFRLLGTIWIRHWSALGALIILILLAYEPFMQTIITQYGVLGADHSNDHATTGRCTRLDSGYMIFSGDQGNPNDFEGGGRCYSYRQVKSQPDFGMTAAVYSGFQSISEKRRHNATVNCSTGNCTFDDFTSLGICSKCADISEHVEKHSVVFMPTYPVDEKPYRQNASYFDNMCSFGNSGGMLSMNWTYTNFSVGVLGIANHNGIQNVEGRGCNLERTTTYLTIRSTKNIPMSFNVANASTGTAFVLFQGLRAPDAYVQGKQAWEDSQPTAFECELSFCAKLYSSKYENGQIIEHVVDSWSQPVLDSYKFIDCSLQSYTPLSGNAGLGPQTDFQVAVPMTEGTKYGLPENLRYNVSQAAVVSIVDWFEHTFGNKMIYPAIASYTSAGIAEVLYSSKSKGKEDIDAVSDVFEAVADSMSVWMRDIQLRGMNNDTTHTGTANRWIIHYGLRWPFLVLPLVLEVTGALYVGFTIWDTERLGVAVRKDSALATLVYGLDGEENRALLKEADVRGKLDHAARKMRVGMVDGSIVHAPELEPDELLEDSVPLNDLRG